MTEETKGSPSPAETKEISTVKNSGRVAKSPTELKVDISQATSFLDPTQWAQMKSMSQDFVRSGALPEDDNAYTVLMKLQAGREMGMKPIESVKAFYFVNGSINIFGSALMRRIREHGWNIQYIDEPNKCVVKVERGDEKYEDSLTFEEAKASGWTHTSSGLKPAWREGANRKLKLRYGAVSLLIKTYIPEVLGSASDVAEVAMDYDLELVEDTKTAKANVKNGDEPATMKQIEVLEERGIEIPEDLTKKEAVKLMTSKKVKGKDK